MRWSRCAAVVLAATGAMFGGVAATASPEPIPVVYDGDFDFDDAATLAYLCQEHKHHRIDLRAVTVVNNGAGTPGRSLTHARTLLARCGLPNVPVAEGSPTWVNPPPPEGRKTIEDILTGALADGAEPYRPAPITAPQLIANTVRSSGRPVTVLATGPLTNLASALKEPGVARRLGEVHVMGGALKVPGNLWGSTSGGFDRSQEFNIWIDPRSAGEVFAAATARRATTSIVPLDATNWTPVTQSYVDQIGVMARTEEARLVHAIFTQPDMPPMIKNGELFWWDPLTAVAMVRGQGIVASTWQRVGVVQQGESAGRTIKVTDGPWQLVGITADRDRFEGTFLAALNGR